MRDELSNLAFEKARFNGARLVFCERFTEKSDIWNLTRHKHTYIELLYFLEGGARIHGDRDDVTVSVFDVAVYPENFAHQEAVDFSHHQEIVCLGIQLPGPSGLTRIRQLSDLDNRLRWLFVEIHSQATSNYSEKFMLVDHLVRALLHYVRQAMDAAGDTRDPISRVISYLHENLSQKITVDELAALANYSPSYLDRRFKDRTGSTPIKYLDAIRLEAAGRLLRRRDMDIGQVAPLIGFDDPKYFSRRFSAMFGMPPSRYRSLHLPGEEA